MPHRPSRGVTTRIALLVASSRVGKRKQATADPSLLSFSHIRSSPPPVSTENNSSLVLSVKVDSYVHPGSHLLPFSSRQPVRCCPLASTSSGNSTTIFKPRCPTYLAAFNVRTLKQAGQQAALPLTPDSIGVDVCCVSETRIQDSSVITELTAPLVSSHF